MNNELARKQPATVRPILPRPEILTADLHSKRALMLEVHAMVRRGEIGGTYDLRCTTRGWAVKVTRIAEPATWWRRNRLRLSLWTGGGLGLLWLLGVLIRSVVAALAGALPLLVGGGVLLAALGALGGRRVVNIVQRVDIRR
jgi:hypothetical protein